LSCYTSFSCILPCTVFPSSHLHYSSYRH
jgi:hypothetical protein